ncbi:MAG TPA: sigma-70 family RNA polymerase sigma factor [Anaerovoracaceae bacterium]|nr:sigma-70 family RNA polymerase sigma factor [Anaerovoracaceae bacterium]
MVNKDLNFFTDETLVQMAQEGSRTAEEYLIEKYKEIAKEKAKIYYIAGGDNEDVIQEGMIGVFKAIKSYDDGKGASFKTFAEVCINRQIINAIKNANRLKHQPLNQSLTLDGDTEAGGESSVVETIPINNENNPETLLVLNEIIEYLRQNDNAILSKFENKVFAEKLKGKDYVEIARELNQKPKAIDNALQRIKKKIAVYLGR